MALSLRRRLKQKTGDKAANSNKDIYIQAVFDGKDPLLLAALDMVDIGKGFVDSFKPYKSKSYVKADAAIPLRGLGNLILSAWYAATAVLLFPLNVLKALTYDLFKEGPGACIINLAQSVYSLVGGLVHAATTALRGLIELATAPLTWFIRMPIRSLITAKKGDYQPFEENAGIQRLVRLGSVVANQNKSGGREKTREIIFQLQRKFDKSTDPQTGRGQSSKIRSSRQGELNHATAGIEETLSPKDPAKLKAVDANAPLTNTEQQQAEAYFNCFRK